MSMPAAAMINRIRRPAPASCTPTDVASDRSRGPPGFFFGPAEARLDLLDVVVQSHGNVIDSIVMIGTSAPRRGTIPPVAGREREERSMESLTSGTFVGAGSFRCCKCDYTLTLSGSDTLTACPSCGGSEFVRASLFGSPDRGVSATERIAGSEIEEPVLFEPPAPGRGERLAQARSELVEPGEYLCFEEGDRLQRIPLTREWTRIGRSLAADVRFDDPTVSRRHALIVRHADGVRLLDDRSLNGVFVNGARVDGRALQDGDEIVVGRYRLLFVSVAPSSDPTSLTGSDPTSLQQS